MTTHKRAAKVYYKHGEFSVDQPRIESDFSVHAVCLFVYFALTYGNLLWFFFARLPSACRKTDTKVTTSTNHNKSKQRDQPIRTPSNYLYKLLKVWPKSRVQVAIGFTPHWLKNWRAGDFEVNRYV